MCERQRYSDLFDVISYAIEPACGEFVDDRQIIYTNRTATNPTQVREGRDTTPTSRPSFSLNRSDRRWQRYQGANDARENKARARKR